MKSEKKEILSSAAAEKLVELNFYVSSFFAWTLHMFFLQYLPNEYWLYGCVNFLSAPLLALSSHPSALQLSKPFSKRPLFLKCLVLKVYKPLLLLLLLLLLKSLCRCCCPTEKFLRELTWTCFGAGILDEDKINDKYRCLHKMETKH